MKKIILLLTLFNFNLSLLSQDKLDTFIENFDIQAISEMKLSNEQILEYIIADKVILLDIRFPEEQDAWSFEFAQKVTLSDLPEYLDKLPKDKIIVTSCPKKDRAIIAAVYLISKGYDAKYLSNGLLGLTDHLRGGKAIQFIKDFKNK